MSIYIPESDRYTHMEYANLGKSGLKVSPLSLGFWHNFGGVDSFKESRKMVRLAFDKGICHFDLANNYGPPAGSAEENFGRILRKDFLLHRDEMTISTKAGWEMWPGPYGNFGSRKYLLASLDQSLQRMGLDYVDIFYHHRPDPNTPLEESIGALEQAVRSGKAIYVGISSYSTEQTAEALKVFKELKIPCLVHQMRYSLLARELETSGLDKLLVAEGVGGISFSPLYQGILSGKYLNEIPENSRAARPEGHLKTEWIEASHLEKIQALKVIADKRGQSLSQLAIAWTLHNPAVQSTIIGPRNCEQLLENIDSLKGLKFTAAELKKINTIFKPTP